MEIDAKLLSIDPKRKNELCSTALSRWLDAEEIQNVLIYYNELGFLISKEKPFCPSSGNLYLYDRTKTKDFRQDGVEWALKKRLNRIQETYQKIKIKGDTVLIGFYARMASNQLFQRRIYRLIDEKAEIILIHYRLCKADERHISYYPSQNYILQQSQQQMLNSNNLNVNNVYPYYSNINDTSIENDMLMDLISLPESNIITIQPLLQSFQSNVYLSNIADFSPCRDVCNGGVKLLICLEIDLPTYFNGPNSLALYVAFGDIKVRAEILSLSVIRCRSPIMKAGWNAINIQTLDGVIICPNSEQQFEHYDNNNTIDEMNNNFIKNEVITHINNDDDSFEREHKIRIIEKLSSVTNSINPSIGDLNNGLQLTSINNEYYMSNFGSNLGPGLGIAQGLFGDNLQWIDDHELVLLPSKELEEQMDLYLISIVNQLIQVASLEDDLKSELEAWDSNGFSIIHYCCLYNYHSLIPVLLSKGIDINSKTRCGSSPLHISAGSGFFNLTKELIDNNANYLATDSLNLTPYDKALQSSHYEIADYLSNFLFNEKNFKSTNLISNGNISTNTNENNQTQSSAYSFNDNSDNNEHLPQHFSPVPNLGELNKLLLNDAFSSLSLADKCAFSLSFSPRLDDGETDHDMNSSRIGSIIDDSIDIEMQSVLSESDKESLEVAMSMMGVNELNELEIEASRIQNNVRGWLLRKNYINLRDAAKLLQNSWRGKRHLFGSYNKDNEIIHNKDRKIYNQNSDESCLNSNNLREKEVAAAKLQSFTRKILEKKKFSEIRKQAIASLVIQNSLTKWWKNQLSK